MGEREEGVFSELVIECILTTQTCDDLIDGLESPKEVFDIRLLCSKPQSDGAEFDAGWT